MINEAMRTIALADEQLAKLIGLRIYPVRAPEKATRPFIVYKLISNTRSTISTGFKYARYQIDITPETNTAGAVKAGSTYTTAHEIAQRLDDVLTAFKGDSAGVCVLSVRAEDTHDTAYNPENPDGVSCDFIFHYKRLTTP